MSARWLLAWCCAAPLFAQLHFFAVNGASEQSLDAQYSLGTAAAGDSLTQRLRLKNLGTTDAALSLLSVAGEGFVLKSVPALPQTISAGKSLDFTVSFQASDPGAYSASLKADRLSLILQAKAVPAVSISVEEGSARRTLTSGATVDFGSVERGASAARRFFLENQTTQVLAVGATLSGPGFRLDGAPPACLAPGDSAVLAVVCEPAAAGALAGNLQIAQRQVLLKAMGVEPPLPHPEILLDLPNPASAQQGLLRVPLASASQGSGSGKLTVDFRPAASGALDDPAVLFPATGNRVASVNVAAGDAAASFGGQAALEFQTGTTAGTLLFTLQLGGHTVQASVTVAPASVHLDALRGARSSAGLDLRADGFDNTRSAGPLRFTFYDRAGNPVPPGAIPVDISADFRRYFAAANAGGLFELHAVFPVSGAADQIAAAELEITNSAGTTRSERITF